MKVAFTLTPNSQGIFRVVDALGKYSPSEVEFVQSEEEADVVVMSVTGRRDKALAKLEDILSKNKKPVVIQYAVRSTQKPHTKEWSELWRKAHLTWSYYNLNLYCEEDSISPEFNFYHAPLGVESEVFSRKFEYSIKDYVIATNSLSYLTESVREVIAAAARLNETVFYLGEELDIPNVTCRTSISDEELSYYYNHSIFVSGLRRKEGFELPAVEGLFCGARPIFFDQPHYRQWFNDFGIFIPETPREAVIDNLEDIFKNTYRPVSDEEIERANDIFNWKKIVPEFWRRVIES